MLFAISHATRIKTLKLKFLNFKIIFISPLHYMFQPIWLGAFKIAAFPSVSSNQSTP
jgi:hypothetical protein